MGLPATDAFTGTNGTALATYSANWTVNSGSFDIQSNAVHANTVGTHGQAHWNADTFSDNQYAQVTISAKVNATYIGPAVRVAAAADTGYKCVAAGNELALQKTLAGTVTQLTGSPVAMTINVGDVIRLEVVGSSLNCFVNGISKIATTDTSITSGFAGIGGYSNGATNGDNWEGGDIPITTHQGMRKATQRRGLSAR